VLGTTGPVSQLVKSGGDSQSGEAGTALSNPLIVTAVDQFGNPISGASVTFSVVTGGGSITSSVSVTTAADGKAQANVLLGSVSGAQQFAGSTQGVSPVTFTASATLTPSKLVKMSGDNQTGHLSTALAQPLKVKVPNIADLAIPNQTVTWAVASGGGSVANQSVTDA